MSEIYVDTSYDPNSWKAPKATDLVSLKPGSQYQPTKCPGGICCDCRMDVAWDTTQLTDGVYTLVCHKCGTDHTAITRGDAQYVRNQVRVGDNRWYLVEKS